LKLILASSSKYRKELLSRLRLPFSTAIPAVDESPATGEQPETLALRLAQSKALEVAKAHDDALIIGSDQVACCGNALLGKPGTHERAVQQLRFLSGREALFHTAICVHSTITGKTLSKNVINRVQFRTLSPATIERYVRAEEPFDCAGSAKSEGLGITLIQSIMGEDPNALIGLPLIALVDLLLEHGIEVP